MKFGLGRTLAYGVSLWTACMSSMAFGQAPDSDVPKAASKQSLKYHAFRLAETQPAFGLASVKKMIANIKSVGDKDSDSYSEAIPNKAFARLSTASKFTYCLIHPEDYSQNCDGMPVYTNEENLIFAEPAMAYSGEGAWSDRQVSFLHHHRNQVIEMLHQTIRSSSRVAVNLKRAILEIDAYELIPDSIWAYKKTGRDLDILSMLSLLMKHAQFGPFRRSALYKQLYGPEASYQTSVPYSKQLESFILENSMRLYRQKKV